MSERPEYYSERARKMDEFRALFAAGIAGPTDTFGVETPEQEEARRRVYFSASPDEQALMRAEHLERIQEEMNSVQKIN